MPNARISAKVIFCGRRVGMPDDAADVINREAAKDWS
jgi:hypothetical protein